MVKFIIVYFLQFLIGLTLLTQVIIPLFTRQPFFWLFKSNKSKKENISSLDELKEKATKNKEERSSIKDNLEEAREILEDIRSKTD